MYILVINSGSSSIKYSLYQKEGNDPICSGLVQRIGEEEAHISHRYHKRGEEKDIELSDSVADHAAGMEMIGRLLTRADIAAIQNVNEIELIGHRIVHGGQKFTEAVVLTAEVKEAIRGLSTLAPLHNPANLKGVEITEKLFPKAIQMAVFDTAFHRTLPEKAFRYALPNALAEEHGLRVYGFHGISHQFVSRAALKFLELPGAKIITMHLGSGCSMAAVAGGVSIDTSMGITPLDGLVMGTRSGAIDPSVLLYLQQTAGYTPEMLSDLLNHGSGMHGLTGISDMRDIEQRWHRGDPAARLAYDIYCYRIRKFIGSYAVAMNGLDALVFTGGVGEHDTLIRELVCENMDVFGISLNKEKNQQAGDSIREISNEGAQIRILIVPTNEEWEIAEQCRQKLTKS